MGEVKDLEEWLKELEVEVPKFRKQGQTKQIPHIEKFFLDMDIKPGEHRVPTFVVYYTYKVKWEGILNKHKFSKIKFFKTFNKYFQQTRTGKQRYYLLEKDAFDLSREGVLEAQHYDKKYQGKKKKKAKKKVSGSKVKSQS